MKLKPLNPVPGTPPTVRGASYVVQIGDTIIARAWPRKRGAAKTGYDLYKQGEFAIAAYMAANPIALDLGTATEMVKGTQFVPRDWLMKAAYGRAYEIVEEDGFRWPSYRDMAPNPQYVLDLITTEIGSLIWRADVGWVGVPPGNNGQVLTWADGPDWRDPTGGGGGGSGATWQTVGSATISTPVQWVNFPALTHDEFLLIGEDITSTTSTAKVAQLSTDGGATYYQASGDYWYLGSSGNPTVAAAVILTQADATDGRYFLGTVHNAKIDGQPHFANRIGDNPYYLHASLAPVTGIRIGVTSGLMNGGKITVLGRG